MLKKLIKNLTGIICLLFANQVYSVNYHEYNLKFNADLTEVEVTINLTSAETTLRARDSSSQIFVEPASECKTKELVTYKNKRLLLNSDIRCITYSVRLQQITESRLFKRQGNSIVTQASEWLFLPRINTSEKVLVKVALSPKHNLSVPWEPTKSVENEFLINPSPNSGTGLIIIGDFDSQIINHKGTELRVAYLPGNPVDTNMIKKWLMATVDNVSLAYGLFPNPNPQIIIVPYAKSWSKQKSPVPFGRVVRDYGESVQFFIDQRQSLNQFNKDWTATHEFSHLLLPYISWKNRWLSEGFASYYQNVLLARAGVYTEQRAWQKLYDGFMRGKVSAPELSPNSAAREGWGGNMKVYWSGAALFFIADVRLRKESGNTKSLDTTLKALKECCLPSSKSWSGSQIMRQLDSLSDTSVFSDLYDEYANNPGFLPYEEVFEDLGIQVRNGKVRLKDSENMDLRKAIVSKLIL